MKLTFKQYLDSKEQLRRAVDNVPVAIKEYDIIHYCTLPLGEYEEDKININLKPKHRIVVEWQYDQVDNPTPLHINVVGVDMIDSNDRYQTFWSNQKMQKWLHRHSREVKQ